MVVQTLELQNTFDTGWFFRKCIMNSNIIDFEVIASNEEKIFIKIVSNSQKEIDEIKTNLSYYLNGN